MLEFSTQFHGVLFVYGLSLVHITSLWFVYVVLRLHVAVDFDKALWGRQTNLFHISPAIVY